MNYYPTDDILNVAVQANIRSSHRLACDISRALKCPMFDAPETGAKLVYPTSHIIHLANQSSHHPLLMTISQKLRFLYNLLQHHPMCPEWITPQLHAIEQRINDLIPDTPSIPMDHTPSNLPMSPSTVSHTKLSKSAKSPRRIKRKSRAKKSTFKKSKYHQHCTSNTVQSNKTRSVSTTKKSNEFKQLRSKIVLIDRKMDDLQKRLNSAFDRPPKPSTTQRVVRRKKKKHRRSPRKSKLSKQQKSREILQKMQKLQFLQKEAMSRLQGRAAPLTIDAPLSMIAAEQRISISDSLDGVSQSIAAGHSKNEDMERECDSLRNEVDEQRAKIQDLEKKIQEMQQKEDSIYQLTMEIRDKATLSSD